MPDRDALERLVEVECEVFGHQGRPTIYVVAGMTYTVWRCKRCYRTTPRDARGYPRKSVRAKIVDLRDDLLVDY